MELIAAISLIYLVYLLVFLPVYFFVKGISNDSE